jgi:hypothetical protein
MPTFGGIGFGGGGGISNANFTNTATGTYSDSGKNYKYVSFTSGSGTLTIDKEGIADVLVVGGGGGGTTNADTQMAGSSGEVVFVPNVLLPVGSHSVVVGSGGGSATNGGFSSLTVGSYVFDAGGGSGARIVGGGQAAYTWHGSGGGYVLFVDASGFAYPAGAAGTRDGSGLTSSITGTSVLYSPSVAWNAGPAPANTGRGGDGNVNQTGAAGIVVVRVEI